MLVRVRGAPKEEKRDGEATPRGRAGCGGRRVVRPSDKGDATQSNKKKTRARRAVAQAHRGKRGKVIFDPKKKNQ